MLRNRLLCSIFICLLLTSCSVKAEKNQYERLFSAILDAQLEAQRGGDYHTMDRVFELGRAGEKANYLLVELLDYYLGAAAGEVLQEFIVSKGNGITPLLKQKRDTPLNCLPKYIVICTDNLDHRNRRIDGMLKTIEKNVPRQKR